MKLYKKLVALLLAIVTLVSTLAFSVSAVSNTKYYSAGVMPIIFAQAIMFIPIF